MPRKIDQVKRRLTRTYSRMLTECEQAIRDIGYWNSINPQHRPLDSEWFVVQAAGLRKCLDAIEKNQPIKDEWLQKT